MTTFPPPFAGEHQVIMLDLVVKGQKALFVVAGHPNKTPSPEVFALMISLKFGIQAKVRMVLTGLSLEAAIKIEGMVSQLSTIQQLTKQHIIDLLKASTN